MQKKKGQNPQIYHINTLKQNDASNILVQVIQISYILYMRMDRMYLSKLFYISIHLFIYFTFNYFINYIILIKFFTVTNACGRLTEIQITKVVHGTLNVQCSSVD